MSSTGEDALLLLGPTASGKSALALQLAREEVSKAKALLAEGENERAYYMALRATNDAELANALARENHAANEAMRADAEAKAAAKQNQ